MATSKETIIRLIQETAVDGVALGRSAFFTKTGIKRHESEGMYWANWSEALVEAGFTPNERNPSISDNEILEAVAKLAEKISRIPSINDGKLERRRNGSFPTHSTVQKIGNRLALYRRLRLYVAEHPEHSGVLQFIPTEIVKAGDENGNEHKNCDEEKVGYIYLIKAGDYFKIGKTWDLARRSKEIKIQLPEKSQTVHIIHTDDIDGIERYWHERFHEKRKNGEWFELTSKDVKAFKKRKFM